MWFTPMTEPVNWADVEEGDTVCWRGRQYTGPKWGKVRYADSTHVYVWGTGGSNTRYTVPKDRVTKHFKGSAEYDRRRYL